MATAQLGSLLRYVHDLAAGHGSLPRTDRQLLEDFSARRDEAAFAALVARHGPMVLRVCRRALKHEQDTEDAFQATFLILARKSASIRKRQSLAAWLHGVARRTALELKRKAARQRDHEARLWSAMRNAAISPTWDDVQAILDEEIERLPETYRAAFVLCVLEGKSGPQAAAELGVKEGAIWTRLTRARQLLQRRLTRRGIELAAVAAAFSVGTAAEAALPAMLARSTIHFGLLVAAGEPAAAQIPSHIAALAAGVTRAMFLSKTKIATSVLLAATLLAGAGALARDLFAARQQSAANPQSQVANQTSQPAPAKPSAKPHVSNNKNSATYSGRVLDPDGKPVAGAKLYVTLEYGFPNPSEQFPLDVTSGPDGRFNFAVPKGKYPATVASVGAMAANHGAGWVMIAEDGARDDLTLQLAKDDVPITGQIVDLEGKPVPGATVRLLEIRTGPGENLGPWLEAVRTRKGPGHLLEWEYLTRYTMAVSAKATTDGEGRFGLAGIGRNRLVRLQLDGPTIASQVVHILTRPGAAIEGTYQEANPDYNSPRLVRTYYGANFRHAAAPTRPIVGVVRDQDTNQPLARVTIQGLSRANYSSPEDEIVRTTTDAQGRYRLTGLPTGGAYALVAIPDSPQPYLSAQKAVPASAGLDPVTVDIELKRGIWIEGKITDKVAGKPVPARVEYFAQQDNPNLRHYPGFEDTMSHYRIVAAKEDGSYRVAGLPGAGLVVVWRVDHYLRAPDRDDQYGNEASPLPVIPFPLPTGNYCAVAPVKAGTGVALVKRDVTLDPGWRFTGTVLGPDGKPLAGARIFDLGWAGEGMKTAEFTARRFNPRRPRHILFQHLDRGLVGEVQPPKENGGSVTVKMQPGAAVTGRLIDADGQPRAGVELALLFRATGPTFSHSKTDQQGRFRFGALLPRYDYRLSDRQGAISLGGLDSGRTKDLGDVQMKVMEN